MKNPLVHAIDAIIVFVMTCGPLVDGKIDTTFLGATGMFLGFVIAGSQWLMKHLEMKNKKKEAAK